MSVSEQQESIPLSASLIDSIANLSLSPAAERYAGYWFPPTFKAIDRASRWLRFMPDTPLNPNPVTAESGSDIGVQTLAAMINGSIEKQAPLPGTPEFETSLSLGKAVCVRSEGFFLQALDGLDANGEDGRADIIVEDGRPILFRKRIGSATCLTLCDISINGITYPAGSITRPVVDLDMLQQARESRGGNSYNLLKSDAVTSLSFLRLSTFIYPEDQRVEWEKDDYRICQPSAHLAFESVTEKIQRALN